MHILQTYSCRLLPTPAEKERMQHFAGCCRYVWNRALALQNALTATEGRHLDYYALAACLKEWKKETHAAFLNDAQSQILQQSLRELERANKVAAVTGTNAPGFRKKRLHNSFRYPQGFKLDEIRSRVYLPKIGWVRFRLTRPTQGTPKQVTVACINGQWHAAILVDVVVDKPKHASSRTVTIDTATPQCVAALSDGTQIALPENIGHDEKRLIHLRRQLRRRQPHSRRWEEQSVRVRQQYARIRHTYIDILHKATDAISKAYAVVVLKERPMKGASSTTKNNRAEGDTALPLGRVRSSRDECADLHHTLLKRAKAEFERQLEYKMMWRGGKIRRVAVPPEEQSKCSNEYIAEQSPSILS